ncbi:serine/threonine-protein kinase [Actinokineospora fastidiosa]|uniref:non-specific serine/threonine protein kinase n=1 Tax=Actinokineospora fastidiosa TaxID=1816 RepID=A0A918GQK5_9PSEU|nr:serine/threonine-protein kinase [Actinokineospora fastidiosa]GGS54303.1 kinase [Actinokineospora fastidiosa]
MNPPPEIDGMEFIRELGRGGFAAVYLYREKEPYREVAVKVFFDAGMRAEVLHEANTMAALEKNDNIAHINKVTYAKDGSVCLVMKYFDRGNYATRVANHPLSVREVADVGVAMADAVAFAHRNEFLHCDIKPANILISDAGKPKLADFGIARPAWQATTTATTATLAYSPPWAAPEVIERGEFSPLSDVFALAATLWHLLVGHSPFELRGEEYDPEKVSGRVLAGHAPPTGRADVPSALENLLARALHPDPARRPPSAAEFGRQLASIHVGPVPAPPTYAPARSPRSSVGAPDTSPRPLPGLAPPTSRPHWQPETRQPPRPAHTALRPVSPLPEPKPEPPAPPPRRAALVVGGAGLLAAIVIGAVVLLPGDEDPAPPTTTQGPRDPDAGLAVPPGKPTVKAIRTGDKVRFTWTYSAAAATDTFAWRTSEPERGGVVDNPELSLAATGELCLQVKVQRVDGSNAIVDWSEPACA